MSRFLFIASAIFLVAVASCKNGGQAGGADDKTSEDALRQRIEQMMKVEVFTKENRAQYLGKELCELYDKIEPFSEKGDGNLYLDFQWAGKVLDACCEDPNIRKATLKAVRVLPGNKAEADVNYVDPPCYDWNYTLLLDFNGEEWIIEDVVWHNEGGDSKETDEAKAYLEEMTKE
ncbi:MAG: hypothetical protein J6X91_05265 [Bacteroidales bacterium]|nr:hypothetical protein [Bacteroidales bacterium]